MTPKTIAIVAPGDMGHGVGAALRAAGHDVVTSLAGRSERSRGLAAKAGMRDLDSLDAVVEAADLFLSILPPDRVLDLAEATAAAMRRTGATPPYMDCNAVAPETATRVAGTVAAAGALAIDCGIVGLAPGKSAQPTRFYVSGDDVSLAEVLAVEGILVKPVPGGIGRASALKMLYAGLNKGRFSLFATIATAAEAMGLTETLTDELGFSQPDTLAYMQRQISRLPADSARWAPEMDEIAATLEAAGITGDFHHGAAWIMRLMAATPMAAETRETIDDSRTLEETLKILVRHLDSKAG